MDSLLVELHAINDQLTAIGADQAFFHSGKDLPGKFMDHAEFESQVELCESAIFQYDAKIVDAQARMNKSLSALHELNAINPLLARGNIPQLKLSIKNQHDTAKNEHDRAIKTKFAVKKQLVNHFEEYTPVNAAAFRVACTELIDAKIAKIKEIYLHQSAEITEVAAPPAV